MAPSGYIAVLGESGNKGWEIVTNQLASSRRVGQTHLPVDELTTGHSHRQVVWEVP